MALCFKKKRKSVLLCNNTDFLSEFIHKDLILQTPTFLQFYLRKVGAIVYDFRVWFKPLGLLGCLGCIHCCTSTWHLSCKTARLAVTLKCL